MVGSMISAGFSWCQPNPKLGEAHDGAGRLMPMLVGVKRSLKQ